MGLFDSFYRTRVCPRCRHKGARQFMWKIKCPNMACSHYDPNLQIDPSNLSGSSQDYQAYKGTFTSTPRRSMLTGKIIEGGKPLRQDFDPGPDSITLRYRNFRGNVREYVGDKRTIRVKGNFISIHLVPTGKRVAFNRQFIENLSKSDMEVLRDQMGKKQRIPSSKERQVLGYHKKHGTMSALYETIRRKYPDWEGE